MDNSFEVVGTAYISLSKDKVTILRNNLNRYFFCRNLDEFLNSDASRQHKQQIQKFISNTAFLPNQTVRFYFFDEETKKAQQFLGEAFAPVDENLLRIVKLSEGADSSDLEKFSHICSVEEYRELNELGSNLSSGVGFPGRGLALILCTENLFGPTKRVFVEVVRSYMEGYMVEHHELTPELFALCKADVLSENYFYS